MGKKKPKANGTKPAEKPPGCYVLSLSVENVRCFGPKQTLDCSDEKGRPRQWTVILGDNGSGKTTLLQAIACHEWVVAGNENPSDLDPRILLYSSPFLRSAIRPAPGKSDLTAVARELLHGQTLRDLHARWLITSEGITGYESNLHDFVIYGYGPNRSLVGTSGEMSSQELLARSRTASLFYRNVGLRDAEKVLMDLDYASKSSGDAHQAAILLKVIKVLEGVLPGVQDIQFVSGTGYFPRPRVEFKTDFGWVPLSQLGHGYQTMIAWVVDFVSRMVERYPDSPNPLAEPAVCLVDEIDLHLHPVWQRKVIGYLSERFPNTQFIVTAHSPLVVQAAASADANIAVLERSKEKDADGNYYVEIKNNPEDVKNWRLDQILTSDLFGGLSLNSPKVEELFKEKEHLAGLKRPTPAQKARLIEIEAELTKLPVGDDAREVREMQAIRDALNHLQKRPVK